MGLKGFLLAAVFLPGCGLGAAEAPVATFEAFYAATTGRDLPTVRALLCPAERRVLADVGDDELLRAFAVVKVLQRVELASRTDAAAVVIATDALGQTTRVQLRADLSNARGWCIAGPAAPTATSTTTTATTP
jgi:hypothetical protein